MTPRRLVPGAVVLAALGALGGAAVFAAPSAKQATPVAATSAPVTAAVRACPPGQGGDQNHVAMIAWSPAAGSGPAGQAELTSLPQAAGQSRSGQPVSQTTLGSLSLLTSPASQSKQAAGVQLTAAGSMAQGIEAEVADGSGLASIRCGSPGSDIWFVGPGQQGGAGQIQLDLMNVDAVTATVDVNIITDAGQVQGGGETGVTVPPHQMVTESLSSQAGGSSVVAVEVRTTAGRVAAATWESGSSRGSAASWLPAAAPPATHVVIPGVPPASSGVKLFLVVPGTEDAKVNVGTVTPQGTSKPLGTQAIDLPGGSASTMSLTLGGADSAVEVTSNVPVTAAIAAPGSGLGTFTAATAPIDQQAVIAGNTTGSGMSAQIVLSAPTASARVRIMEVAENTLTATEVITVPAEHTLVVPGSMPAGVKHGLPFAVVIAPLPGAGPVYAARVETQNASSGQSANVVSIIPAISAMTSISLPPVRNGYDAISP